MVSVNPSPDLNLNGLPTTTTTTSLSLLTPKLEPKPEPYDPSYFFTTPNPNTTAVANVYAEYDRLTEAINAAFAAKQPSDPNSRAIVVVPPPDRNVAVSTPTNNHNHKKRSSELARLMDNGEEERRKLRERIRETRMLYEALRVCYDEEDERHRRLGLGRLRGARARSDLRAATMMKDAVMWQNRDKRIVGPVAGVQVGDVFVYRMELCVVGLHGTPQSGIDFLPANCSSTKEPIATSIVVSG